MENTVEKSAIWSILEEVCDPEVPVLSILDLGIVRAVILPESADKSDVVEVQITPTYSGCPAMNVIAASIRMTLAAHGYPNAKITEVLTPAWTTDWLTEAGKRKLKAYGITPPQYSDAKNAKNQPIPCPLCDSTHTELLSEFGSTSCKSLYRCLDCLEPFDYFKCH